MSIFLTCSCGKRLRAKDETAGKRVNCPSCGSPIVVSVGKPSSGDSVTNGDERKHAQKFGELSPAINQHASRFGPVRRSNSEAECATPKQQRLESDTQQRPPDTGWFYEREDRVLGPMSFQVLRQLIETGVISGTDRVKKDGMDEWVEANAISSCLNNNLSAPSPVNVWPQVVPDVKTELLSSPGRHTVLWVSVGFFCVIIIPGAYVLNGWIKTFGANEAVAAKVRDATRLTSQRQWDRVIRIADDALVIPYATSIESAREIKAKALKEKEDELAAARHAANQLVIAKLKEAQLAVREKQLDRAIPLLQIAIATPNATQIEQASILLDQLQRESHRRIEQSAVANAFLTAANREISKFNLAGAAQYLRQYLSAPLVSVEEKAKANRLLKDVQLASSDDEAQKEVQGFFDNELELLAKTGKSPKTDEIETSTLRIAYARLIKKNASAELQRRLDDKARTLEAARNEVKRQDVSRQEEQERIRMESERRMEFQAEMQQMAAQEAMRVKRYEFRITVPYHDDNPKNSASRHFTDYIPARNDLEAKKLLKERYPHARYFRFISIE